VTLSFLFTDIEGSTDLWERAPEDMRRSLARHDELVRKTIAEHEGRVFATGGDGVAAVFESAIDAVHAASELQSRLAVERWPTPAPIRVRIGVHTGEAEQRDGDFFGPTLNRTARLMSIAHGGQVVCSATTAALVDGNLPAPLVELGHHRLRDLSAPVAVFQIGDGSFPPLRSLDSVPSNLPTALTELVGRDDEIRTVAAEVRAKRLVTLTGVGGVGKTRLALAVGGAVAPDFVDGCWLIELAPLGDGSEVVRTIATALGAVNLAAGDSDVLVRYLEHRRLVLILDNCEHLLDDVAAFIDDVLAAAPDVHIVTTSREPLGVDGEVVRRVRSLDDTPAVDLFVERARAADGEFEMTEQNRTEVAEICRHLDGIPLAIELAAARVRAMAPAEIARRLDDRFRMLTGGRRAQERHRTLQAAVGWSYDLLSEDDRRVFARLSVFPATFDLPAALAVAATDDVDAVVRLVDRSLVVHDWASGRYRLLETLRQYGSDRLAEIGESDVTRGRYARHYVELITRHGPGVADHRHDEAMAVLVIELDNFRATVEWLVRGGRWDDVRHVSVMGSMFFSQLSPAEALDWLQAAIDHDGCSDVQATIDALGFAAMNATNAHRFDDAVRLGHESIERARANALPESPWARFGLCMLSMFGVAPADEGLVHADAMVATATARGDDFGVVAGTSQKFVLHARLGHTDEAENGLEAALAAARRLGNRTALSVAVVCALGHLVFDRDPPEFARARDLLDRHGEDALGPYGGLNVAWLLTLRAVATCDLDPVQAARDALASARYADRAGSEFALVCAVRALAIATARAGLAVEAIALSAYAEQHAEQHADLTDNSTHVWLQRHCALAIEATGFASADIEAASPPVTRQDLLALLARIEQATAK
jgi:predicted ATPase/class 3 adenylate cyclase